MPETSVVKPASSPSAKTLRPFKGRSKTFLFSITWPSEEVSNSSNGALAATSTVSDTLPGSIVMGNVSV